MYEYRDGEVVQSDEMSALCPVLGYGDSESSGIFLHEYDGKIYICGSLRQHFYVYGDGIGFSSFVTVYNGEKFEKQTGTDENIVGSEFSGEEQDAEDMADFLDEIGLPEEAEQIRSSWIRCFEFTDDVEMLMLITGENNGKDDIMSYYDTSDPSDLGEVILTLKLTWDDSQISGADQETENNGEHTSGETQEPEQPEVSYQLDEEGVAYATQKFLDEKNFQTLDVSLDYRAAESGDIYRYSEAFWVPIFKGKEKTPSYYAIVASGAFENPGEAIIYSSDVYAIVEGTAVASEFDVLEEFNVNQYF